MNNEELADILINSFCGIWLSLRATTTAEDLQMYKVQLMKGLVSNNLNTPEAMARGVDCARTNGGQYPPSVPEFIKMCRSSINRPEHKLLVCENPGPATDEERELAHKILKDLRDSL